MAGTRLTIGLDQLDNFSIDDDLILYWDGELVQTTTKYSLPWWINVSIILGGIGGATGGIAGVIAAVIALQHLG